MRIILYSTLLLCFSCLPEPKKENVDNAEPEIINTLSNTDTTSNTTNTEIVFDNDSLTSVANALKENNDFEFVYNRSLDLLLKNELNVAKIYIDRAIEIQPDNSNAYYIRGNIMQKLDLLADAVDSYTKSFQLNPNHIDAILKCAIVHSKLKNEVGAYYLFKRACEQGSVDGCKGKQLMDERMSGNNSHLKVTTNAPINMYPDNTSREIAYAKSGSVEIIEKFNESYYKVKYGNVTGYMFVGWILKE